MQNPLWLWLWMTLTVLTSLHAETGSDTLLDSLGSQAKNTNGHLTNDVSVKFQDPFMTQFYSSLQAQPNLPYEFNSWVMSVLKGKYEDAAHLWSVIQQQAPSSLRYEAKAAYLYVLWKLDLPQTFFEQWLNAISNREFADSRIAIALDQTIAPLFDPWLKNSLLLLTLEQREFVRKIPVSRGPHYLSLKAWALRRSGEAAREALSHMRADHWLAIPLAQTLVLASARKNDLKGVASLLKMYLEPAIEAKKDVLVLSQHWLGVARLLYQAGALDAAEAFYERIPTASPDYLRAREELLWVWLRQGNLGRLRGELASFRTDLFEDKFVPDVYVTRAVSNLKLCYYDKVEKDLSEFIEVNQKWAKKVDAALKSETPPAIDIPDWVTRESESGLKSRERELSKLRRLSHESIKASLPAVGPQRHWEMAEQRLLQLTELNKKELSDHYRRQWKNRMTVLREAIQKMRFVKVEFLSQIRELGKKSTVEMADVRVKRQSAQDGETQGKNLEKTGAQLVFPFDGIVWSDELFRIRAVAEQRCLEGKKL